MAGKRSIFEEVASRPQSAPQGGMIEKGRRGARGPIRIWLMLIFVMVMAMIALGGLTRLTDSGLSITEWEPLMGGIAADEPCGMGASLRALPAKPAV